MTSIPTLGNVITVWNGRSLDSAWRAAMPLVELARPAGIQLHGQWDTLLDQAARAVDKIENQLSYTPDIWLGIAADGDAGAEKPQARWARVAGLAAELGCDAVVINAERWWNRDLSDDIKEALSVMRNTDCCPPIGHTSFGWPIWSKQYPYGGYPDYPWEAFLGEGGADFTHPQVYGPNTSYMGLKHRYAAYHWSWGQAKAKGWYRDDLPFGLYLEAAEANDTAAACSIAQRHESICWWGIVPEMDDMGRLSMLACCLLHQLGYWGADDEDKGRDGVHRFQADHGLYQDGLVGPKTLRALGLRS